MCKRKKKCVLEFGFDEFGIFTCWQSVFWGSFWAFLPTVFLHSQTEVQSCKNFRSKPTTSTIFNCSSSSSASFKNLFITFYLSWKVVLVVGCVKKTDGRTADPEFLFASDPSPTSPFCAEVTPHSGLSPGLWAGLIQSAKAAEMAGK